MERNQEVASEILRQLGGNRFIAMTGAKNFVAIESGIRFRLPRNKFMSITLNGRDEYDMQYLTSAANVISENTDVNVENLHETFTAMTGLYTRI